MRVRPTAREHPAVPAQQRLRSDEERLPSATRQHPAERRQHQPVGGRELWPPRLSPQDRQLMPQNEDLELLRAVAAREQQDEREQPTKRRHTRTRRALAASEGGIAEATRAPVTELRHSSTSRDRVCAPAGCRRQRPATSCGMCAGSAVAFVENEGCRRCLRRSWPSERSRVSVAVVAARPSRWSRALLVLRRALPSRRGEQTPLGQGASPLEVARHRAGHFASARPTYLVVASSRALRPSARPHAPGRNQRHLVHRATLRRMHAAFGASCSACPVGSG